MTRIVDNLIAYKMLTMLITPFDQTKAFKLGIIDKDGNNLIKTSKLKTSEERDAYTYLHRLIFNVKKILNRLPGGESKLKSLVAAFWLVKESYQDNQTVTITEQLMETLNSVTLVEEELLVREFLEIFEDAPTNSVGSGGAVSTDVPTVRMGKNGRRFAAFTVNDEIFRRFGNGKKKYKKWSEYLNLENEGENMIYNYAKKNPKGVIVLHNGKQSKAIRFNRHGGGAWSKIKRNNTTKQVNNDVVA